MADPPVAIPNRILGVVGERKTGYKCWIANERKNDGLRANSNLK